MVEDFDEEFHCTQRPEWYHTQLEREAKFLPISTPCKVSDSMQRETFFFAKTSRTTTDANSPRKPSKK